jgi:hypothetical protein
MITTFDEQERTFREKVLDEKFHAIIPKSVLPKYEWSQNGTVFEIEATYEGITEKVGPEVFTLDIGKDHIERLSVRLMDIYRERERPAKDPSEANLDKALGHNDYLPPAPPTKLVDEEDL